MLVKIKILNKNIENNGRLALPDYATIGSAAMDLAAAIEQPLVVPAGAVKLIPTGIAIYIADPQFAAVLVPRSGLGHKHGIVLGNLVGLIDADYQGEIQISCWNRSTQDFVLHPGDRIAQLMVVPIARVQWQVVDDFTTTARGTGGFGHTGK